jgi:hypothetical protein
MNSPRLCTLLLAAGLSFNSALADFVGTKTNSQGLGSLLDAITNSNTISSLKTIRFNLPGSRPWTITITSSLHVLVPVVVDGTTQSGYDGAFNRIYVEGAAGVNEVFFLEAHNGTTIKGLGLYNYNANGITIWKDSNWNYLDDDYIGFKKTSWLRHVTSEHASPAHPISL